MVVDKLHKRAKGGRIWWHAFHGEWWLLWQTRGMVSWSSRENLYPSFTPCSAWAVRGKKEICKGSPVQWAKSPCSRDSQGGHLGGGDTWSERWRMNRGLSGRGQGRILSWKEKYMNKLRARRLQTAFRTISSLTCRELITIKNKWGIKYRRCSCSGKQEAYKHNLGNYMRKLCNRKLLSFITCIYKY